MSRIARAGVAVAAASLSARSARAAARCCGGLGSVCIRARLLGARGSCIGGCSSPVSRIARAGVAVAAASLSARSARAAARRCGGLGSVCIRARLLGARGSCIGGCSSPVSRIARAAVAVAAASLSARSARAAARRCAGSVCICARLLGAARGGVGCVYCVSACEGGSTVCGNVVVLHRATVGIPGTIRVGAGLCCGIARIWRQKYARSVSRSRATRLLVVCMDSGLKTQPSIALVMNVRWFTYLAPPSPTR